MGHVVCDVDEVVRATVVRDLFGAEMPYLRPIFRDGPGTAYKQHVAVFVCDPAPSDRPRDITDGNLRRFQTLCRGEDFPFSRGRRASVVRM